jgi:hypothetical protein
MHESPLLKSWLQLHSVKMPVGFGNVKTKGRQADLLAHLKKNVRVNSDTI